MRTLLVLALLTTASTQVSAACACCETPKPASTSGASAPAAPVGHPLKGVIVEILAAKSALLVEHEEVPGVMRAMTMLLKVDASTLAAAKTGQTITASLVKKPDGWWLEAVTPVAAP
jgi:Cu/Ag efflux protein CusF